MGKGEIVDKKVKEVEVVEVKPADEGPPPMACVRDLDAECVEVECPMYRLAKLVLKLPDADETYEGGDIPESVVIDGDRGDTYEGRCLEVLVKEAQLAAAKAQEEFFQSQTAELKFIEEIEKPEEKE